jgi:Domain of unknown function (DUF4440)
LSYDFRKTIIELEERLRLAMLASDVAELDALISPDLLFTNHLGTLITKEADLASHRSGDLKLNSLKLSEQHLRIMDSSAVVSVAMHLQGSYLEQPIDLNIRYTRIWALGSNGQFQIIAGHASTITPNT